MQSTVASLTVAAYLPALCLAWLLVGILMGRRQPFSGASPVRQRSSKARPPKSKSGGAELYVGNLPYESGEKEVQQLFSEFGKVQSVRLIENRSSGKSKGYGFVEMADAAGATRAADVLSKRKFKGRRLIVNSAKTRAR